MNEKEYKYFMKTLEKWNEKYDDEVKMIKRPFSSPGYHTTLKGGDVHSTREALTYAVALLDSGIEEYRLRAIEVLNKVISLQDTNPENKTYGIWSWFYEEPLSMMAPPDWNWADFCGKELLQVSLDHSDRIPADTLAKVRQAIEHACYSIIRRNMGPGYTNISIMGTYVTHVAGEHLGKEDILKYAKQRLKELHAYNMLHGAFTEYNSPTYTMIALEDLSRSLRHIKDEESRKLLEELFDMGWNTVAQHFHAPTKQWAGPHSRCYTTLQGNSLWSKLQLALDNRLKIVSEEDLEVQLETFRIGLKCPEKYIESFTNLNGERQVKEMYFKGNETRRAESSTTYLTEEFALGTFYKCDLWNQRRGLVAYFGQFERPAYLQLRCLHDGYDYSSGAIHSVQSKGKVLSIINFATDGGDTHCNLDMVKNATIRAKDFRIRFELGGDVDSIKVEEWNENSITCKTKDITFKIKVPYCSFGENNIKYEVSRTDSTLYIDIVLYSGEETDLCFTDLREAVCCTILNMEPAPVEDAVDKEEADVSIEEGKLKAVWNTGLEKLSLEADAKADTFRNLYRNSVGYINGKTFENAIQ